MQADIKTINALGVEAASVLTAITAQNTSGVSAVTVLDADMVQAQLDAVLDELPIAAAKTGMLANDKIIERVADSIVKARNMALVIDPVMVATSGARLLSVNAERALRDRLLPLADLVTPNRPEAAVLTGLDANAPADELAAALLALGCRAVLVKGGHGSGEMVEDLLAIGEQRLSFRHPRLPASVHGTGCALSAAITAKLALGQTLDAAVESGIDWLQARLSDSWKT
ncbi:MAG: bifunctional hydroxymethylpyrimidine kinase/phosphomethylpyrimidine kinase, partial [Wenzhouxiangella sp.]|nr:bifunctional hydroxymethylpyrimidine kinase/phosphomethylpyrimidine kinase [Wenzhouxiangella sp.]